LLRQSERLTTYTSKRLLLIPELHCQLSWMVQQMSSFPCLFLFHWPGRTCIFTSLESMDLSIMASSGVLSICTKASLVVVPTLPCLFSTITLHCTWLHLHLAYVHQFFTCSSTTAVVRIRISTCWPTATGWCSTRCSNQSPYPSYQLDTPMRILTRCFRPLLLA